MHRNLAQERCRRCVTGNEAPKGLFRPWGENHVEEETLRKLMLVALTAAVVPAGIAVAQSDGLKVTGGGQVVADGQTSGPGDTIAFNAQQTAPADQNSGVAPAKGQL